MAERRKVLETQLASVQVASGPSFDVFDADGLGRALADVADRVDQAD